MRIAFLWVGKTKEKRLSALIDKYIKAMSHFASVEIKVVSDVRNKSPREIVLKEGERLLGLLKKAGRAFSVALDPGGESLSSEELASSLDSWLERGGSRVTFITGGEEGLSGELLRNVHYRLRLTRMTLPHELARLVLVEQVYRALTISKGTGYHR